MWKHQADAHGSLPRMHGGEPVKTPSGGSLKWLFPVCTGVNRQTLRQWPEYRALPRMHGGEPIRPRDAAGSSPNPKRAVKGNRHL